MTIEKLQLLRALNEKRTKGPWTSFENHPLHDSPTVCANGIAEASLFVCLCSTGEGEEEGIKDAAFIAAMANNADWLLGCVEALQWIADYERHRGTTDYVKLSGCIEAIRIRAEKALEGKP